MPLLEVSDLKTHFRTDDGIVKAVDGVSYTVERGSLPTGRYAFRARAWAPRQDEPTERRSAYLRR